MSKITIYEKPTCTTCRKVSKILKDKGIDFDAINYYIKPISKSKIRELLKKSGLKAADIVRKKEDAYKKFVAGKDLSESQLIDLMAEHPDLLQRPIVEKGSEAILARPAETLEDFL